MAEVGDWIERRLARDDLIAGHLSLGPAEQRALGLPDHASEVELSRGDGSLWADWDGRNKKLGGELVAEWLGDEAQEHQLVRLRRGPQAIEVHLVPMAQSALDTGGSRILFPTRLREYLPPPPSRNKRSGLRNRRYRLRARDEFDWIGNVGFERASLQRMTESLRDHGWDDEASFGLRLRGEHLASVSGFDELLALDLANVDKMGHQVDTVRRVLGPLKGRAILADEVGLGKTIEAGLIASELVTRGMARRILVLCPAGLRDQWTAELREKFGIAAQLRERGVDAFGDGHVVMSVNLAQRNTDETVEEDWDLVIVDEAHKYRGKKTRELLVQLNERSRFVLYLTATPVQNSLDELYELVESVRPGTFLSRSDFRRRFVGSDIRTPTDPEGLRRLIRDVMVRTTRAQAGLDNVRRFVTELPITLLPEERAEYDTLLSVLRTHFKGPGHHLRRQNFARRLLASPRALAVSLLNADRSDLSESARAELERITTKAVGASRTRRQQSLIDVVRAAIHDPDRGKVLVFTQHTEVAEDLLRQLATEGIDAVAYHGGIAAAGRRKAIEEFRRSVPVMVATDAGAEGLNLQFCNCVVNYDLPWNPMKIEQRIGRVHRVGQHRDVHVVNIYAVETVEDRVYELLRDKLKMFELLFGQITMILGEINEEEDASVEQQIADAVFQNERAASAHFAKIGRGFDDARRKAQAEIATAERLSYLSTWDDEYRSGLTREGADELRPERLESPSTRRAQVISFTVDLFEHIGATVERSVEVAAADGTTQQTFMSVQLPESEQDHFGQVDRLHLAFEPSALTQHRDAELCAVGSDLFEELVDLLRTRGDLLIEQPKLDLPDEPLLPAEPALRYAGRTVVGSDEWTATASWSTRITGPTDQERIITTGDDREFDVDDLEIEVLDDESEMPGTVDVEAVLATVRTEAADELSRVLGRIDQEAATAVEADNARRREYFAEQIAELKMQRERAWRGESDSIDERIRQTKQAAARLGRLSAERSRAECELIALRLTGSSDVVVRESWVDSSGRTMTLDILVDAFTGEQYVTVGADGHEIDIVACCAKSHVVDSGSLNACEECGTEHCPECGADFSRSECPLCDRRVCRTCIADGLCRACAVPALRPDKGDGLDRYVLGDGSELTVGRFAAMLNGDRLTSLDQTHPQLMEIAAIMQLPVDSQCRIDSWQLPSGPSGSFTIELGRNTSYEPQAGDGSGGLDLQSLTALGLEPAAGLTLEQTDPDPHLATLVERLRAAHPWPDHVIVASEQGSIRFLEVGPDEVTVVQVHRDQPGYGETVLLPWTADNDPEDRASAAVARLQAAHFRGTGYAYPDVEVVADLALERCNDSYLLIVRVGDPAEGNRIEHQVFIPADGAVVGDEQLLATLARDLGTPGARLGAVQHRECPGPVANAGATLQDREIVPADGLSSAPTVGPAIVASLVTAPHANTATLGDSAHVVESLWDWARSLDEHRPDRVGVGTSYDVTEMWVGDGTFEHRYRVEGGAPAVSPMPDEPWFAIDRSGHPVGASDVVECDVCGVSTCGRCEPSVGVDECDRCGQPACGSCVTSPHPAARIVGPCVSCDREMCGACGRSERAIECSLCGGTVCHHCAADGRCRSCANVRLATAEDTSGLPPHLTPPGHQVFLGDGGRLRTVVILGGRRRELATIDGSNAIVDWRTATEVPATVASLTIRASVFGPVSDIVVVERASSIDFEGMMLESVPRRMVSASHAGSMVVSAVEVDEHVVTEAELVDALVAHVGDLPRVPDFDAGVAERLAAVAELGEIPAGTPIVLGVAEEVYWLELTADGMTWCHSTPDDLHRSPVELNRSNEHGPVELVGEFGPRGDDAVRVRGYGEAVEVEVRCADGERAWVVTDVDGWPGRHAAIEMFAAEHGLDRPVGLVIGDLRAPAGPAEVSSAALVERTWTSRLAPAVAGTLGGSVPDSVLQGFEVEKSEIDRTRRLAFPMPDAFRAVIARDERAVSLWHDCIELWRGAGDRRIEYEVEGGGNTPAPVLDDTGEAAWDFAIDEHGHLVGDGLKSCEVCSGSTCDACGDEQGIRPCECCGQPSCGGCRRLGSTSLGAEPVTGPNCACCGSSLCTACRRMELAEPCAACRRLTCHRCIEEGVCSTCRSLAPASREQIEGLPAILQFGGLDVSFGEDLQHVVALGRGGMRAELVMLSEDAVVAWWDLADLAHDEWLLASFVNSPVSTVVQSAAADMPPASEPELVARDTRAPWAQICHGGRRVSAAIEVKDGAEILTLVAESVAVEQTPMRPETCQLEWSSRLPPSRAVGTPLTVESYSLVDRIEVVPEGLRRSTGRTDELAVETRPFAAVDQSMFVGLPVSFDQVELARCDGIEAARLSLGPVVYLVRSDVSRSLWWRVDDTHADPSLVLLGRAHTGRSVEVAFSSATRRHEFTPISITNAICEHRDEREFIERVDAAADPVTTQRMVDAYCQPPAVLRSAPRPHWAARFAPQNQQHPPPEVMRMNVLVKERWSFEGTSIALEYRVVGGSDRAVEMAFDTNAPANAFTIDRSDHLVQNPAACAYCAQLTCSRCTDRVEPCSVCGIPRCGRCGPVREGRPLCIACAGAKPVTGPRKFTKVGLSGLFARGEDTEHQVEIALTTSKATVTVTTNDGQRREWQVAPEHAESISLLITAPAN